MKQTIENCPCCGGPGKLKDTHGKIRQGWVGCPACQLYINWKIDPAGAIAKWNKRVGLTPQQAFDAILEIVPMTPDVLSAVARVLTGKEIRK